MESLSYRMIRAARLDASLYEEVERDKTAIGQAMTVVILAAVAAGLGSARNTGLPGLVAVTLAALAGWFFWSFLVYWIGTRILPEPGTQAGFGELLRVVGFASAPGVIRIVGILPGLGHIIAIVAAAWMVAAMAIAVRQALDYTSTGRAAGVCLIGWFIPWVVKVFLLGRLLGLGMENAMGHSV